ncbi:MAG: NADPH-dependent assimilatory sulfite reductase hemoprotein subunit [Actinomycetia bacterium]|nr:NADPH-dependent assimilatory sulfite reductase hemoprotein subunit [Actinomycetes bacterium]
MGQANGRSAVEDIKRASRYLRGTIRASLADPLTGGVPEADRQLLKFHGTYLQDDRDLRLERQRQKLEPAYQFMVRVRIPGGVLTAEQWLALDDLAGRYGDGSLRLTTRQGVQFHGVVKWHLADTIRAIHTALLTTLGACGDVNRNVTATANPFRSPVHAAVHDWARRVAAHLTPQTAAYHEIWLDGTNLVPPPASEEEPFYGPTYLPRKFKIAFAVPPVNDVDVFAQDLGFIAVADGDRLVGFDVAVGGGMGMTYGDRTTYPQLARVIGFCRPEAVVPVAEQVVAIQRDYGNRAERNHARLKYTIDARGLDWFVAELASRLGCRLKPARPVRFTHSGDRFGWEEGPDGRGHLTLRVESGRVRDGPDRPLRTGLRAVVEAHGGPVCLTPNQNVVLAAVDPARRARLEALARAYGLLADGSPTRAQALACVGLPTCGLAMAESERALPEWVSRIEAEQARVGWGAVPLAVRVSGCPNGCSRPYLAEVGLTGRAPGRYDLYLGGDAAGTRLAQPYGENLDAEGVLAILRPLFARYVDQRRPGERFGDFLCRVGIVRSVTDGRTFWAGGLPTPAADGGTDKEVGR